VLPLLEVVLKPEAVTVIVYEPGITDGIENVPALLLTVLYSTPVASFFTTTFAPETTAFVWSSTTPVIVDVLICAAAQTHTSSDINATAISLREVIVPPREPLFIY